MKANNLAILTILIILNISCKNELINERFDVVGYSIGDSISNDFIVEKEYGVNFKSLIYRKDTLIKISTIGNHISYFHIKQPEKNYYSTIEEINKTFGQPVKNYVGDTIYGVKLNHRIEYKLWFDPLTFNQIQTTIKVKNSNFYNIEITNDSIVERLKRKYIKDYGKKDEPIEIVEFSENE
jgi:hypothetical protein